MSEESAPLLRIMFALLLVAGVLYYFGIIQAFFARLKILINLTVSAGFHVWRYYLFGPSAKEILILTLICHLPILLPISAGGPLSILTGSLAIAVGVITSLACAHVDTERLAVGRGTMALYDPGKGQRLAHNLISFGQATDLLTVAVANFAVITGFALLNYGLYYSVGQHWYQLSSTKNAADTALSLVKQATQPYYLDFLTYSVLHIFKLADVIDVTNNYNIVKMSYIHEARWPAKTLLILFKSYYTVVLLQQFSLAIRRHADLQDILNDYWNPHLVIYDRARAALSQYGLTGLPLLFQSIKGEDKTSAEQRDRLIKYASAFGPAAAPMLEKYLNDDRSDVQAVAISALGHLHQIHLVPRFLDFVHHPDVDVRLALVRSLADLASKSPRDYERNALRSVERPQSLLNRTRSNAAESIEVEALQRRSVKQLIAFVEDSNELVRLTAIKSMGQLKAFVSDIVPTLEKSLHAADEAVVLAAMESIAQLDVLDESVWRALPRLLQTGSSEVKLSVLRAMSELETLDPVVVPALLNLMNDTDATLRPMVLESLKRLNSMPVSAAPTVIAGLKDDDNLIRQHALEALVAIGVNDETRPHLFEMLRDVSDAVRLEAVRATTTINLDAEVIEQLTKRLTDLDAQVRIAAANSLSAHAAESAGAVPIFAEQARHSNHEVRLAMLLAWINISRQHRDSRPQLQDELTHALQELDAAGRQSIYATLASQWQQEAVELIMTGLDDLDVNVRATVVECMISLELVGTEFQAMLRNLLDQEDDRVQIVLLRYFAGVPTIERESLDAIAKALDDANPEVQVEAANTLGKLAEQAIPVVPQLARLIATGNLSARKAALRAVAKIECEQVIDELLACLHDPDDEIRVLASASLLLAPELNEAQMEEVTRAIDDPHPQVQTNLLKRLLMTDRPELSLDQWRQVTTSADDGLRLVSVRALGRLADNFAIEYLRARLSDPSPAVRGESAAYLLRLQPDDAEAKQVFDTAINDPTYSSKRHALEILKAAADEPPQVK